MKKTLSVHGHLFQLGASNNRQVHYTLCQLFDVMARLDPAARFTAQRVNGKIQLLATTAKGNMLLDEFED